MSGDKERARHLMMARLDGELSDAERSELESLLARDEELRGEWERLGALKEVTGTMQYREPSAETWETYWVSIYNRLERGVGWALLSLGVAVLVGYGTWHVTTELLADSGIPLLVKIGIFAAVFGTLLLLVSVVREKLFTRRGERYDEVQR